MTLSTLKPFKSAFQSEDRVYYVDNGPEDTGVVREVVLDDDERIHYIVEWDDKHDTDAFLARQLRLAA